MTTLSLDIVRLPAAGLGPLNPLPPLVRTGDPHEGKPAELDDPDLLAAIAYGRLPTLLPYLPQDGYDRTRIERDLPVAVLENEVLRATFLLDHGGRLWSLVHLPTGRELLHRNSVFQPANLGLRNAWFAGGVEWNLGTTGHTALTCEPLHAVRVEEPDGTPVLRLYEYERSRELVFSIDFSLPPGSPVLLAAVRVTNPNPTTVPLYWWTNIAVPEHDDVRVVAPADRAYHYSYDRGLHVVPVPDHDGRDMSYPASAPSPADWFFDCRSARRPWIAALDDEGRGLLHVSTRRLVGRKLFAWGRSVGGRNWQSFLSGPGERYLEIQAGLARTQFEHQALPAGETCAWVEAFGLSDVGSEAAHGPWSAAQDAVAQAADGLAPAGGLDEELGRAAERAQRPPAAVLHRGSGWGALEELRRKRAEEEPLAPAGMPFPADTLDREQQPWLELLETGRLPAGETSQPPTSYVVGSAWSARLTDAGDNWLTWLHRGVARWHAGDHEGAYIATERSLDHQATAWALRNLAVMDRAAGDLGRAVERYRAARSLAPALRPLLLETLDALLEAGAAQQALDIIDDLGEGDRDGRTWMAELRAALQSGDLDRAGRLIEANLEVYDLQEGEDSLSALWAAYHQARGTSPVPALPARLDYRMG